MWLSREPKNKSVTLTIFVIGSLVCCFKVLLSGVTIGSVTLGLFSGIDFGAAIAALGGVYVLRKRNSGDDSGREEE